MSPASDQTGRVCGRHGFRWHTKARQLLCVPVGREPGHSRSRPFVAAVVLVLLLLFAGCGSTASSNDSAAAASTAEASDSAPPDTPAPVSSGLDEPPAPSPEATETVAPTPTGVARETPVAVRTGAAVLVEEDLAPLHGQRVGLIAHRASIVDARPVAAWLNDHPLVELRALFPPEHGLYGEADAGASVADLVDPNTGVPVYSLYGTDRAPTPASLADIDVLVYDLQDVGVRFYTYTSTLGLAMQAAAAADVAFMVLDRPNPVGGDQLQGPTLTPGLESFIGMYNVPSAYGLTAGELATMIKTQDLLPGLDDLDLTVVQMRDWNRQMRWVDTGLAWIPPSPNLPTPDSALVYPGTVLFEATSVSEGRGTDEPFTLIGATWIDGAALATDLNSRGLPGVGFEPASFTPRSISGAAASPRFLGEQLFGVHIVVTDPDAVAGVQVGLAILDAVLRQAESVGQDPASIIDRPGVFDRLAGTAPVRHSLIAGASIDEILASFTVDHAAFAEMTSSVHLYD